MIGVIVDGHSEFICFTNKYKGKIKVVRSDGARGHDADAKHIVQSSRKQIEILKGMKCNPICIVTDFEGRKKNYEEFSTELLEEMKKSLDEKHAKIVVPNQMIENWVLADIEFLSGKKTYLKDNLKQKTYEGTHGKNELKKCFKRGVDYRETKHCPDLFMLVRDTEAATRSVSFRNFLMSL